MPITRAPLSSIVTTPTPAGSAAVATVATSNVVATLQAANANRLGIVISNPATGNITTQRLFVKMGAGATTTDWSFFLNPGDVWTEPDGGVVYTGIYTAILNSAGPRDIQVTELTA